MRTMREVVNPEGLRPGEPAPVQEADEPQDVENNGVDFGPATLEETMAALNDLVLELGPTRVSWGMHRGKRLDELEP